MTIQDVNLALDIDFRTQKIVGCKIIDNTDTHSMIQLDSGDKLLGKCRTCCSSFKIFLFGKAENYLEMGLFEPANVKIEENDSEISSKYFFDESQEGATELSLQKTIAHGTGNAELCCRFCYRGLKNIQGLTTHEHFCKSNPNRQKKKNKSRALIKNKIQEKEPGLVNDEKSCKSEEKSEIKVAPPKKHQVTQCKYCQRPFSRLSLARRHEQILHERKINFTCEMCGWGTWCKGKFEMHKIKQHSGNPRPFICDLCTTRNTFASKSSIIYHMRVHHMQEAQFMCDTCSKKFICKTHLETHMQTVHSKLRPYPCPDCDKTFKQPLDVKIHRYKIHVPKERKPQFACNVCEFITHDKHSFARHKIIHLGEAAKPFHCKFCKKGFASQSNQIRHEATHLDIRPFVCTFCEKAFRAKEDLKVHVRHHTGERPYECEICGQKYGDRGCYRSHLIGHEKQMGITLDKSVKKFLIKPKLIDNL